MVDTGSEPNAYAEEPGNTDEDREEILRSRLALVQRLGRAAEYKDSESGLHVVRVSHFSRRLGLAVGMAPREAELLFTAAPMHDIGKIAIPDHILQKPGKLDAEEWAVMQRHTVLGAEFIGEHDHPLLRMARDIALTHHERWDGQGYPQGLAGEDIPLAGRIVAIADVFDALTSDRPYHKAWPIERAVELVRREAGTVFDPNLSRLFGEVMRDILQVKREYAETIGG